MKFSGLIRELFLFSAVLVLGTLTLGSIAFGWTAPSFAPPSGNVAAPLNAGATSQTKSGNLTVAQLTSSASSGTAPLVVTSQTKVANLNADLLDGLDASGFGDATLANQATLLSKVGSSTDAGSLTPSTLFAGIKGLIGQEDNSYTAGITLTGIGSAPSCPGGWTEVVGQTSAGSISPVTSISTVSLRTKNSYSNILCTQEAQADGENTIGNQCNGGGTTAIAAGGGATSYTFYYRVCALPR
jgi:hypothetical protein